MSTFIGFNTINQYKKFTLTGFELIKRDLLNALNIRQGEKPGNPSYGTSMWNLIFEPQTPQTAGLIEQELARVCAQDPRIYVSDIEVYPQENGILIELQVQTVDTTTAERLSVFFDQEQQYASFL